MNNTSRKWLGALALAFVMATLALQFGSAKAQYGYEAAPYAGVPTSMIEKGGFLYIVQGSTLHKVRTRDLAVVGRTLLKPITMYYGTPVPTATPYATATTTPVATPTPGG